VTQVERWLLLVDDDPDIDIVVTRALRFAEIDARVRVARSGTAARDLLAGSAPRLILLDLRLPGESGLELLAGLRQTKGLAQTPIVLLTGNEDPDLARLATAMGATEVAAKPIDYDTFIRTLSQILTRHLK